MQIRGEEFVKKVQIQQEREELERKLNELEEVQMSFNNNESVNFERNNNYNNYNNMNNNEHELDNIMLSTSSNEDNKKKYLILGIVLVVLFLLTIIIIRLLTNEPPKEDQFTTNNLNSSPLNSSPTKKQDSDNIEENFQKIMNERVKKDVNEPMVPEVKTTSNSKTKENVNANTQPVEESASSQDFDNLQKEAQNYTSSKSGISDETMDQTIKKIEKSKNLPKEKAAITQKETSVQKEVIAQKEEVVKKVDTKKSSIKDLMDSAPYSPPANNTRSVAPSNSASSAVSSSASGYFIQIGAFTKKPTDSYLNTIKNASLKYKVYEEDIKGTTYNKVLVGPYSSKEAASQSVESVKEKLNVSSAFVVKF